MQLRLRNRLWCIGTLAAWAALASGCGARAQHESDDLTLRRPGPEREPPVAELDAAQPPSVMDAAPPPSVMDAAPPLGQPDGSDATVLPSDAGAAMRDAQADASPAFYGEAVLQVLTKPSLTSQYQPGHLLAIWVEDDAGNPIKVLALWAGARRAVLTQYGARVGLGTGGFSAAENPLFDVDTITGATQRTHQQRVVRWDMTDHLGQPVAQAQYSIVIELADDFDATYLTTIALFNGPESVHLELAETESFGPIELTYTPPSEP